MIEREVNPRNRHRPPTVRLAAVCPQVDDVTRALERIGRRIRASGQPLRLEVVRARIEQVPRTREAHHAEAATTAAALATAVVENAKAFRGEGGDLSAAVLKKAAELSTNQALWRALARNHREGRKRQHDETQAGMLALALPHETAALMAAARWPAAWNPAPVVLIRQRRQPRPATRSAAAAVLAWRLTTNRWPGPLDPAGEAWLNGRTHATRTR